MHNAFLILVYLFLCFFGLGNIASISSYDWNCVRYFLNVFSPFTMLAFCLAKIFIPFLCVSCAMRAIHVEYYTMGHSWGERYWDESNLRKVSLKVSFEVQNILVCFPSFVLLFFSPKFSCKKCFHIYAHIVSYSSCLNKLKFHSAKKKKNLSTRLVPMYRPIVHEIPPEL